MSALVSLLTGKRTRSQRRVPLLTGIVFGCVAVIEALHGHDCSGDGCVLCFAAALAHVLLFASIGTALVCPIMRVLAELWLVCLGILPCHKTSLLFAATSRLERVELTPLTMGVRFII